MVSREEERGEKIEEVEEKDVDEEDEDEEDGASRDKREDRIEDKEKWSASEKFSIFLPRLRHFGHVGSSKKNQKCSTQVK